MTPNIPKFVVSPVKGAHTLLWIALAGGGTEGESFIQAFEVFIG
jgi:hypothetical protein